MSKILVDKHKGKKKECYETIHHKTKISCKQHSPYLNKHNKILYILSILYLLTVTIHYAKITIYYYIKMECIYYF